MARPTKKPKRGELHRLHIILPAEMLDLIDRVAADLQPGPLGSLRAPTRTDAIRLLLYEGLRRRGLVK